MAYLDVLDKYGPDRVSICPQDVSGLLDVAGLLANRLPDTAVYCCGPEPLLAAVERAAAGWPSGSVHVERFAPRELGEPVRRAAFEVELRQTGTILTVPEGVSILDAVHAADVYVSSSCSEGTCGSCETVVLEGVPEHRDSVLTEAERAANDRMMICVSRSLTDRLVLDL
jgi:ferredoxin